MRRFTFPLLTLLALLIGGCSNQEAIKVGVHPWIGYESLYLAEDLGLLNNQVQLSRGKNANDSLKGLTSGELDAAALTLDEVLVARSQNIPLTILLIFDVSSGADALIARPEIESLQDLKGKRIAFEPNAVGQVLLAKILEKAKLSETDVQKVAMTIDQQKQAWQQNKIDAAVSCEPTVSELLLLGGHRLFDSRQTPDTIFDVLAVRTDRVKAFEKQIHTLIKSHFSSLKQLQTNREATIYRIAAHQNVSVQQVKMALRGVTLPSRIANQKYLSSSSEFLVAITNLNQIMTEHGLLPQSDPLNQLFTAEFLPNE